MYAIKPEMLGHLEQEEVEAIHMSRARFLELVEETFSKMDLPESRDADLRAELLPVASKMPTFPIGTWLSASRGCGCVVGEYLIARKQIDQHNAVLDELAARKATVEEYVSRSSEISIQEIAREGPERWRPHEVWQLDRPRSPPRARCPRGLRRGRLRAAP